MPLKVLDSISPGKKIHTRCYAAAKLIFSSLFLTLLILNINMTFKKTVIMLKYTLVIFKTLADYKCWRQGSKNWFAKFWKENEFKWSLFNNFWGHWYILVCPVSFIPWLIYNLFTLTPHSSGPQLRWLGFDSKHFFLFVFSKIQKYDDETKICENAWLSSKRKLKIKTNCLEDVSEYIFLQY